MATIACCGRGAGGIRPRNRGAYAAHRRRGRHASDLGTDRRGGLCAQNRSGQSFFINGRVVRCALLTQALESACRGRVTIGMYPMCALHVDMPPGAIDVNVHPNKLEIRFRDEAAVRAAVDGLFEKFFEKERMTQAMPAPLPESRAKIQYTPPEEIEQTVVQLKNLNAEDNKNIQLESTGSSSLKKTEVRLKPTGVQSRPAEVRLPPLSAGAASTLREPHALGKKDGWLQEDAGLPPQLSSPDSMSQNAAIEGESAPDVPRAPSQPPGQYRLIGAYKNTYLLVEQEDALIMIDQHAAHERILYEKYKVMLEQGTASQQLLTPLIVQVSAKERAVLMDNLETLSDAGFEVDSFGERDIAVRAVPFVLSQASLSPFFMEMIEQLDRLKGATLDRRRGELIQLSCKRAVKAGDRLTDSEIDALILEMARTNAPPTCPHGRPVLRIFRANEIERMFKRQQ